MKTGTVKSNLRKDSKFNEKLIFINILDDPFFNKKADDSKAVLEKVGFPKEFMKNR